MPDITITPGTFNPPGTLAVVHGALDFPKTPVQQVKRPALQYNSRWVEVEEATPPVVLPVIYSYCDFITGDITIGVDVDPFDAGITNFITAGVRYIPDTTYAKTAQDIPGKTYSAVGTPQFVLTGGTEIDIGTVEIGGSGGGDLGFNNFLVTVGYSLSVAGGADGGTYTTHVQASTTPTTLTGTMEFPVLIPVNPVSNGWIDQAVSAAPIIQFDLLRNGVIFDRIFILLEITGSIHFVVGTASRPTIATGHSVAETLYRQSTSPGAISPPSLPYAAYVRESWASQGNLLIP